MQSGLNTSTTIEPPIRAAESANDAQFIENKQHFNGSARQSVKRSKSRLVRWLLFLTVAIFTCAWLNTARAASYEKDLWLKWEKNNPMSTKTIDHQLWQSFITQYVTKPQEGLSLINYRGVSNTARIQLQQYIKKMSRVKISQYNRKEQLAFWLNLHNALTINTVLQHYPIDSIQDINISPGLFTIGPWQAQLIEIEGTPLSLRDIENRIIRPIWNDPRTLYAIQNASIGAPNLFPEAFVGNKINKQLNQAARNYVNCLRGAQVFDEKLSVSKLYDWYEEDFGGTKQSVIEHIKLFANTALKEKLEKVKTIDTYVYNWHLNAVPEHAN